MQFGKQDNMTYELCYMIMIDKDENIWKSQIRYMSLGLVCFLLACITCWLQAQGLMCQSLWSNIPAKLPTWWSGVASGPFISVDAKGYRAYPSACNHWGNLFCKHFGGHWVVPQKRPFGELRCPTQRKAETVRRNRVLTQECWTHGLHHRNAILVHLAVVTLPSLCVRNSTGGICIFWFRIPSISQPLLM